MISFTGSTKAPLSTASASASLKMILAPFPPSSKLTLLKSLAAFSEIKAPALVEPVNEIIFTGSTRAGALISENAAKDFKRVSLELGGKGANIIFKDADAEAVNEI